MILYGFSFHCRRLSTTRILECSIFQFWSKYCALQLSQPVAVRDGLCQMPIWAVSIKAFNSGLEACRQVLQRVPGLCVIERPEVDAHRAPAWRCQGTRVCHGGRVWVPVIVALGCPQAGPVEVCPDMPRPPS
jgi:hypothetical protein